MARYAVLLTALAAVVALGGSADAADKKGKGDHSPEAIFKKLDANGDGKLSKDEFAKLSEMMHAKGKGKGGEKAKGKGGEALFAKLDANGDGSVSLDEFKKLHDRSEKKKKAK